jgi:AcrR family transcriptional regulator
MTRAAARRAAVEREILDAAWTVMARDGAAVSVRAVARSVGLRQQSLTHYFPTKQALLDALFADGFTELKDRLNRLPATPDPVEAVVAVAVAVVDYFLDHPSRYHLMFQRSVPDFAPSDASHNLALGCLTVLTDRLTIAGVTTASDVALVRSLISGLAAEQIANDPGGRQFADQTQHGIRALISAIRTTA